jgi:flagellar hook-associated protein 3 FlgL
VLQQNLNADNRVQEQRIQVSTGKKSQNFAGISDNVRRLENLEADFAANEAFQRNVDRTELRLQTMESSVDTLGDVASRFRTQLLSAANDGGNLDSIDLETIASTFQEEALGQMNAELGGRFLFSGSATNTKPVELGDGSGGTLPFEAAPGAQSIKAGSYFQGNGDELSARISETTTLDYGITAEPGKGQGFHKLMTALSRVIDNPNSPDAVEASIRDLSGGEAQSVLSFDAVSDPAATLNSSVNFGTGTIGANADIDLTGAGVPGAPVNIAVDGANDTLFDIAERIDSVAGLTAQVGGDSGAPQIEVFSDNGAPVNIVDGGGGDNLFTDPPAADRPIQRNEVEVDGAIAQLADTRSEIGSRRGLLETTKTQLDDAQVRIEGNISDIEDVNLTRAMTLLAQNQTTLSSSFAVTARLQQVSLLNFLR